MRSLTRRQAIARGMAGLAALASRRAVAAGTAVDLQLVLAADVSRSIDAGEFQLQRQGYAEAFRDPRVLRAIQSGPLGRIAVAFLEWSGEFSQAVTVDWTLLEDVETGALLADAIAASPRPFADRTAIGMGIDFAVAMLGRCPYESQRRIIDVSGDGTNTNGRLPTLARDTAVEQGIIINGLVILSAEPSEWNPYHTHPPEGLPAYYRQNVVGGPGSFVMVVEDFASFAYAIANKLIREIAGLPGPDLARAGNAAGRGV